MPGRNKKVHSDPSLEQLLGNLPNIFEQVQVSIVNHQKNFIALYKVHLQTAQHIEKVQNGRGAKLVGERAFQDAFLMLLMRVLSVKKGVKQADRILKFVGGYIRFLNEKNKTSGDRVEDAETTASRFTARVLEFLVQGFIAKDKNVRYRTLHAVVEMVAHLGEIDEDTYLLLRDGLLERVNDKEVNVRLQAVIALSKLCGSEDPSEAEEGDTVLDVLVDLLAHDSSPDVRHAVLMNIPITATTLPRILDRTRDTDATTRKMVYYNILELNSVKNNGESKYMGPTHPRALSIAQRELIVTNGLGDREPSVRAATGSLLGTWVDVVNMDADLEGASNVTRNLLEVARLLDPPESVMAADALLSIFTTRVDIFNSLEIGEEFWKILTSEKAFLARVFVDHCKTIKDEHRLETVLPVVTALAFRVQQAYNDYVQDLQDEEMEVALGPMDHVARVRREEARAASLSVISEMLKLAVSLDYSDEIGRRKMFQLVRDMLSKNTLPPSLIPGCLDVLRTLSINERDLIRVVVEIVHELRDPEDEEESEPDNGADADTTTGETPATIKPKRVSLFEKRQKQLEEMTPDEKASADDIDLRCLTLCIGMLERVDSTFEENVTLEGIMRELIIPSVQRNEVIFREQGMICLGLCCLIARRLALQSIKLFMSQIETCPSEDLKLSLLKVVFDMLMVHEAAFAQTGNVLEAATEALVSRFEKDVDEPKVMALLSIGISKLVLSGLITDVYAVKNLVLVYLDPSTADNQELRQCLAFFLPAYSHSSVGNQRRMREIFIDTYVALNQVRNDLEEEQQMVSAAQVSDMFVDWTDPNNLANVINARAGSIGADRAVDDTIHLDMARDTIKALLDRHLDFQKEERKVLHQMLGKLHIPEMVKDDEKLHLMKFYMDHLRSCRPPKDIFSKRAFTKFEMTVCERFAKQLGNLDEEGYRKREEFREMFEFLDSVIPDDDEGVMDTGPQKRVTRKRHSGSTATTSSENDHSDTPEPSNQNKGRRTVKKPRMSHSDSDVSDVQDVTPHAKAAALPTRTMPKRTAATTAARRVTMAIASKGDSEDGDDMAVPRSHRRSKPGPPRKAESAEEFTDNDPAVDTEKEEDEVDALLVEGNE